MPGWSTLLNIASKAAGTEGATAASLKSAAKQVAIEKIKSAAANAPRAIFNAAGGDRVPLLRHGADILGAFRKASTEGDSPEDKQEKLKARQESKTERAQAKRERDEDDNEKRQEKAEREAAKHDADGSTSTLQLIARDVSDIKEYILSPKTEEEKKDGIFGKILSGILSIATLIPGIVVAIRSATASMINAIRGLITGLGRGAATAEAAGGAAKATEAAGGAAKIVPAARGAALMTRVAGLANKIPGAKLLGRVAAPLGIGLAGVDMAKNGVGVGNSMDMAANAMLMAPSPHAKALGGGMLAGRFLGDMLGINDEENEAKANLKKAQAALARQEESNAKRLADRERSTMAPAPVGVGDGGSLTKQTPAAVPKLTAPKLPAPAPLAPGSDMAGKSAVQLLSDLVKAATTPNEGIYIRNGVKTIQPKESTNQGAKPSQPTTNTNQGAKPAASNAKGGAQPTEPAPKSSLSVPTNREYTETEKAVMARAENAGKKAGIEPVDLPDSHPLNAALPTLTGTNPASIPKVSRNAEKNWISAREDIVGAAQVAGVDPGILAKIANYESKFDPNAAPIAKNASRNRVQLHDGRMALSSAHGYGQFTKDTWTRYINKYGQKYGVATAGKLTNKEAAKFRGDKKVQAGLLAEFTKENIQRGRQLGGSNDDANVYALHNLGGGDGAKFLKALKSNPNAPVSSVLSSDVISGNSSLYGDGSITISEAYQRQAQAMRGGEKFATDARRGSSTNIVASTDTKPSIPPMLRAPPAQQGEAVYTANKKAEAKASAPIVVQGGPTIVQGGGGKSRNSSRGGGGAQTTMVTRNPDPAIRATILGWLQRMV